MKIITAIKLCKYLAINFSAPLLCALRLCVKQNPGKLLAKYLQDKKLGWRETRLFLTVWDMPVREKSRVSRHRTKKPGFSDGLGYARSGKKPGFLPQDKRNPAFSGGLGICLFGKKPGFFWRFGNLPVRGKSRVSWHRTKETRLFLAVWESARSGKKPGFLAQDKRNPAFSDGLGICPFGKKAGFLATHNWFLWN